MAAAQQRVCDLCVCLNRRHVAFAACYSCPCVCMRAWALTNLQVCVRGGGVVGDVGGSRAGVCGLGSGNLCKLRAAAAVCFAAGRGDVGSCSSLPGRGCVRVRVPIPIHILRAILITYPTLFRVCAHAIQGKRTHAHTHARTHTRTHTRTRTHTHTHR